MVARSDPQMPARRGRSRTHSGVGRSGSSTSRRLGGPTEAPEPARRRPPPQQLGEVERGLLARVGRPRGDGHRQWSAAAAAHPRCARGEPARLLEERAASSQCDARILPELGARAPLVIRPPRVEAAAAGNSHHGLSARATRSAAGRAFSATAARAPTSRPGMVRCGRGGSSANGAAVGDEAREGDAEEGCDTCRIGRRLASRDGQSEGAVARAVKSGTDSSSLKFRSLPTNLRG